MAALHELIAGKICSRRNSLEQFRYARGQVQGYDSCMNFTFLSPDAGTCAVKLWASGRYGFSLPKKVDIMTAAGDTATFLYFNRKVRLTAELSNRAIVKIAIAQFLAGLGQDGQPVEIDHDTQPYEGALTPIRSTAPRAPLRVRPGKLHARPAWADQ